MMKSNRSFFLLIILVLLSRIPLLFGGYGTDGDAWRIAKSALTLWNDGIYHVSRFPGFPIYEFLQTPIIVSGGAFASNSASIIVFIFSIVVFREIIRYWDVPNPDLLLISYAFLPILWKNSAVTMDYVWGLFGILASLYFLLNKNVLLAGIILGLAAGTRITHIIFFIPFIFIFPKEERKQWVLFSTAAIATTIVCYVPVAISENILLVLRDFLDDIVAVPLIKRAGVICYRSVFSVGLLGMVSIVIVLLTNRRRIQSVLQTRSAVIALAIILTGFLIFIIHSDEREYLMPIFPFALVLIAFIADRKQYLVIMAALISYGFFSVDVIEHSVEHPRIGLNIQKGYLVKEYLGRREIEESRMRVANSAIPDSSFVMIGLGPVFWLDNPLVKNDRAKEKEFRQDCSRSVKGNEIYFIYGLYKPQMEEVRRRGYRIYYWGEMKEYLQTFVGYDIDDELLRPIDGSP